MEPIFEYFEIIVNRLQNPLPKGAQGAKHHIYPKSCGGWNLKCNLVKLTRKEHYRCHELLPYIFKDLGDENGYQKMLYAWHLISTVEDGTFVTQEEYEKLLSDYDKMVRGKPSGSSGKHWSEESRRKASLSHIGKSPANKGVPHTPEELRKMSLAHKGKKTGPVPLERRIKISESLKGHEPWNKGQTGLQHVSAERKKKQSEQISGRKWFNDGSKSYMLKPDDPKIAELHLLPGRK